MSAGLTSAAFPQGYTPDVAAAKMTTLDGLRVTLVASEPEVRQPILVKVDDRGRLWTIQYLIWRGVLPCWRVRTPVLSCGVIWRQAPVDSRRSTHCQF